MLNHLRIYSPTFKSSLPLCAGEKPDKVVSLSTVDTNDPTTVPKTIIFSNNTNNGHEQNELDSTSFVDKVRTGVYYENIELCRSMHPLQMCNNNARLGSSDNAAGSGDSTSTSSTARPRSYRVVGRPLPPAPPLLLKGRSNKKLGPTSARSSRQYYKRATTPKKHALVATKTEISSASPPKSATLSQDEQLFVEVACALAKGAGLANNGQKIDQKSKTTSKSLLPRLLLPSAKSSCITNTSPLAPPPFILQK